MLHSMTNIIGLKWKSSYSTTILVPAVTLSKMSVTTNHMHTVICILWLPKEQVTTYNFQMDTYNPSLILTNQG